ncbi:hypothetical protein CHS0354_008596 [Potamilus streckersoni]|uniref:Nucleosome-remodeling factor subunit BPTF n=1 Tax=Potamilus streckersoni TaxID=2493646 RepID=A0AAE0SVK0_9BIVA|nr:hypothetical protein CHS0354_008596 [Potamilus streckersoni]
MSSRGRRGRGRPPKTLVSTGRTNFLRKPKAFGGGYVGGDSSRSSTPVGESPASSLGRGRYERGRPREAAQKSRNFIHNVLFDDDELSRDSLGNDLDENSMDQDISSRTSEPVDDISNYDYDRDSDITYEEESDSDYSDESFGTNSTSGRRKLVFRRPKSPEIPDDREVLPLILPPSSNDLIIPTEHIMQCLGLYEVLRHFRVIVRLSPYTFEDFCAALLSDEQCALLSEIHIQILKAILREEENNNSAFGPSDLKDSINVSVFFIDSMSWPEVARAYLDSDRHGKDFSEALNVLQMPEYPFVSITDRLKVLQTLTDLFLGTNRVREEIVNEGNIQYDDHCRACHKLGDLLCCETCSAVYHLTCVDPPMEEVPDDDWLCSVCKAHQVMGVTDCISEAEKGGLLCRQEPIGIDRHGRKYWFLVRRIIVEGENEVWYYSTKGQIDELLEVLEGEPWEKELVYSLKEMRDDIARQMEITEKMTTQHKGNKKSALENEIANLTKTQAERAQRKAKEEEERLLREEEKKKREEERKTREEEEEQRKEQEGAGNKEGIKTEESESIEAKITEQEQSDTKSGNKDLAMAEHTQTSTNNSVSVVKMEVTNTTDSGTVSLVKTLVTEIVTTTTTTTTVKHLDGAASNTKDANDSLVDCFVETTFEGDSNVDGDQKETEDEEKQQEDQSMEIDGEFEMEKAVIVTEHFEKGKVEKKKEESDNESSGVSDSNCNGSSDKYQNQEVKKTLQAPTIMNIQSVCPNVKATILKATEKMGLADMPGTKKTLVVLNKDGGKMTFTVASAPSAKSNSETVSKSSEKGEDKTESSEEQSNEGQETRRIITRSKTGSLTPKLFTDSVTGTTMVKTTSIRSLSSSSSDDLLVINKDGEITRVTRSKSSSSVTATQQQMLFRLGQEGNYKQYQNQYSVNTLALNKHQHNEERDKRRYLSHKFSLTTLSEFKWNGSTHGNKVMTVSTLRLTIAQLEGNIPTPFLHPSWPLHRQNWQKAVHLCQTPSDFALALSILEACMKPVIFNPVWSEALGHSRLHKITCLDREEFKKKEKEQRKRLEEENDGRPLVWIKYTLGVKHQVWKQRGEEYRVSGGHGWFWISCSRRSNPTPQDSVGLRAVASKLQNRKRKAAEAEVEIQEASGEKSSKVMVGEETEILKTESLVKDEAFSVDRKISSKVKMEIADFDIKDEDKKESKDINKNGNSKEMKGSASEVKEEKMDIEDNSEVVSGSSQKVSCQQKECLPKKEVWEPNLGMNVDTEKVSPKKDMQISKSTQGNFKLNSKNVVSLLTSKVDVDLIDVTESLLERTYYPKVTKPYARLDNLLDRRMKMVELEKKQREGIEQQIQWKMKFEAMKNPVKKEEKGDDTTNSVSLDSGETPLEERIAEKHKTCVHPCYSPFCRNNQSNLCYSPLCRYEFNALLDDLDAAGEDMEEDDEVSVGDEDKSDSEESVDDDKEGEDEEEKAEDEEDEKEEDEEDQEIDSEDEDEEAIEEDERAFNKLKKNKKEEQDNEQTEYDDDQEGDSNEKDPDAEDEDVDILGDHDESSTFSDIKESNGADDDTKDKEDSLQEDRLEEDIAEEATQSDSKSSCSEANSAVSADIEKSGSCEESVTEHKGKNNAVKNNSVPNSILSSYTVREGRSLDGATAEPNQIPSQKAAVTEKKITELNSLTTLNKPSNVAIESSKLTDTKTAALSVVSSAATTATTKRTTTIALPGNLAQLISAKTGTTLTMSQAQQVIRQALEKMSLEELRAKIPPERSTKDKIQLLKLSKFGPKKKTVKKAATPTCHKFLTPSGKRTLFSLEKWELKKLSRKGAKYDVSGFKYDCKMNNVNWPYPCPRPLFKTAWRYRTQTMKSLAGSCLQLRILWAVIRWDDMATKPPAGGTNTISTESEITTTELLKRRDIGPNGLRSEFLVRKIIIPLGVPAQPKEKYTPQRSGLRERKKAESPKLTEPSVTERWTPEEELELWEIKQFGEKVEKQRAALQQKLTQQQTQQNAAQIKEQMEEQLKQQRLAMQQKRLQESQQPQQGKPMATSIITAVVTTAASSSTLLKNITSLNQGSVLKTTTSPAMTTILSPSTLIKKVQMQPKTIITTTASTGVGGSLIRPTMKVQLPSTTVSIRPSTNITLAPKPGILTATAAGTAVTAAASSTVTPAVTTIKTTRLVTPVQTQAQKVGVQIRPQVVAQGVPGQVQNVHIIQGPQGQLQVRGLMAGQQIIRLPDGRLQLITVPQQQGVSVVSTAATTTTPTKTIQVQTQLGLRTQAVLVSGAAGTAITQASVGSTTPTKVLVPAQATTNLGNLSSVAVAAVSNATPGQAISVLSTSGSQTITKIISPTNKLMAPIIQKIAAPGVVAVSGSQSGTTLVPRIITRQGLAPQIVVQSQQGLQPKTLTTVQPTASQIPTVVQAKQEALQLKPDQCKLAQAVQPSSVNLAKTPEQLLTQQQQLLEQQKQLQQQTLLQQEQKQTDQATVTAQVEDQVLPGQIQTVQTKPQQSLLTVNTTVTPPTAVVTSPPAGSKTPTQKYAVTPQVVQEVVRQALLQNQTPEIQAKLLAMQKHMTQQQQVTPKPTITLPTPVAVQRTITLPQKQTVVATPVVDLARGKTRPPLTSDQKDEQSRLAICGQVLKGMLDKIEREEKQEQKRQRKQESTEEKQKRVMAAKLQGILFKHKEALKKEILRKRSLMEKNLQQELQAKKKQSTAKSAVLPMIVGGQVKKQPDVPASIIPPLPPTSAQAAESAKAKKRKQKVIFTGNTKSLNPKRKLYCICKTPYDDSRFYIGCDLCSNWFHGECVNILEDSAKFLDAYICDECKKQQECATEELYCLCRTPYDETKFYVGCDRCQDWFHGHCVGITEKEASQLDTYICPSCQKKDAVDPVSLKELSDSDYEILQRLMSSMQSHKMAWPFLEPVDPDEVPDYYAIVKEPMDLNTLQTNLDNREYVRLADFVKDVTKIFDNCRLYNPPDTSFYQCAEVLETYFVQRLKALKDKLTQ